MNSLMHSRAFYPSPHELLASNFTIHGELF